jgi:hypothetical protein
LSNESELGPTVLVCLQRSLEAGLAKNPHYRYAVGLGQLAPVEIQPLNAHGEPVWQIYQRHCLVRGQKLGNIKPVALDTWEGWPEVFDPLAIGASADTSSA